MNLAQTVTSMHLLRRFLAEVFEVHVAERARNRQPPVHPVVRHEAAGLGERKEAASVAMRADQFPVIAKWASRLDIRPR